MPGRASAPLRFQASCRWLHGVGRLRCGRLLLVAQPTQREAVVPKSVPLRLHLDDLPQQTWMQQGACRDSPDPDMWFEPERTKRAAEARSICRSCPVQSECLSFGSLPGPNAEYGIFGALGPKARGRDEYRQDHGFGGEDQRPSAPARLVISA